MLELMASVKKSVPDYPPPVGVVIEDASAPDTWTATSGTTTDGNTYFFNGTTLDTLRIPYQNTPYPTGESVDISLRAIINTIYETSKPVYFLSKWAGATAGENFYDFVLQRHTDGKLAFNVGSLSSSKFVTSAAIALNKEFELRWRVTKDGVFSLAMDGTVVYTGTLPNWRQSPLDWMIGSYLNQGQTAGTVNGARTKWELRGLRINRGKA